jgi:23S rRNA pseudouridine1911/1915/1917 synthase
MARTDMAMADPDVYVVQEEEAGSRLDSFLATRLGGGRHQAQLLVRGGLVKVDDEVAPRTSTNLRHGATVEVTRVEVASQAPVEGGGASPRLLYQDDLIAVVDKPAGMVVHPAPSHHGSTLADVVRGWDGPWSLAGGPERPGIVHRLDRGTSGLLVLARTEQAHLELSRQLQSRALGREYWALARGAFKEDRGRIDAAVGRDRQRPRRMSVTGDGRDAATEFSVLERLPQHTALRLRLLSGRTHQIRVHLAYIGRPLEGDPLYGSPQSVAGRPALHAAMLHLRHPGSGIEMIFCSPLPDDLELLRHQLGGAPEQLAAWPWRELGTALW